MDGQPWRRLKQRIAVCYPHKNVSDSATTKETPFEVVFEQKQRSHCAVLDELASQDTLNEEDLPGGLLQEPDLEPSKRNCSEDGQTNGGESNSVK